MKRYQYIGAQPHNSTILIDENGKKVKRDLLLSDGQEVSLPEDHSVIQALVRQGHLIELTSPSPNKKQ